MVLNWTENKKCIKLTILEFENNGGIPATIAVVGPSLTVPEQGILSLLQLLRPLHPCVIVTNLVKVQDTSNDKGIIVNKSLNWGRPVITSKIPIYIVLKGIRYNKC